MISLKPHPHFFHTGMSWRQTRIKTTENVPGWQNFVIWLSENLCNSDIMGSMFFWLKMLHKLFVSKSYQNRALPRLHCWIWGSNCCTGKRHKGIEKKWREEIWRDGRERQFVIVSILLPYLITLACVVGSVDGTWVSVVVSWSSCQTKAFTALVARHVALLCVSVCYCLCFAFGKCSWDIPCGVGQQVVPFYCRSNSWNLLQFW